MQQQQLDRLVLNSLQGLYEEETTNSFVSMAEQGNPAEAIAGTAMMLIGAQLNAAKQAGVEVDKRLIPVAANEISKHLGQLLLVAGVIDKESAKATMQEAAGLFKQQMMGGGNGEDGQMAEAPVPEAAAGMAPQPAPQGGLIQQAQQPGV